MKKMTRKEIVEKVIACLTRQTVLPQLHDMGKIRLKEDLEFDDIDKVALTMKVEQAFGIRIEGNERRGLNTVAGIVNLVERKLED